MKQLSFQPKDVKNKISPFAFHLLSFSKKILLHKETNYHDSNNNLVQHLFNGRKGMYYPTKSSIHIPYGFPSIYHEIAHIVELNNYKRLTQMDFGMEVYVPKLITSKFAITSREVRVRAIQLHLLSPRNEEQKKICPNYNIFNNETFSNFFNKNEPIGKFKSFAEIKEYFADVRDRTYFSWSLDRIEHEWKKRMEYISHWQES